MSYYRFIEQASLTPREPELAIGRDTALAAIDWICQQSPEVVHYDLETTSLNYHDSNNIITTVGLATADWLIGIDLLDVPFPDQQRLWDWMRQQRLGGFNLSFDLAWPWGKDITDLNIVTDTLLWFRLLATEAHPGQSHTLETLIERVLGWPTADDQKEWLGQALASRQLSKSRMWNLAILEPEQYTRYCALDAEASLQGDAVLQKTVDKYGFTQLRTYFDEIVIPNIKRQILATYHGVPVDREALLRNIDWVKREMIKVSSAAYHQPDLRDAIDKWTADQLAKDHVLSFSMKRRWAKSSEEPWKYPDRFLIAPTSPEKCPAWSKEFGGKFYEPMKKITMTGTAKVRWPKLNFSSQPHMITIIYDYLLKDKWTKWTRPDDPKSGFVYVEKNGKQYSVELTNSGGMPTGGDILDLLGDAGKLIQEYKSLETLLVNFLLKYEVASRKTGCIHAQSKILATVTGRLAGGSS